MAKKPVYESLLEFMPVEDIMNRYEDILIHIREFFNSRADLLSTRFLGERIVYSKNTFAEFMGLFNLTESDVKSWLKLSAIPSNFVNINKPSQLIPCLIMMVFYKNHKRLFTKYPELTEKDAVQPYKMINMYFITIILSGLQGKYFQYPPRQDIWLATLEGLSNKYKLKQVANILEFIEYYSDLGLKTFEDDLSTGSDEAVIKYINGCVTYLNSALKNVRGEFDKNYKEGNSVKNEDFYTEYEEGKKELNVQTSISTDVESVTRTMMSTFIQDPVVDRKSLEIACRATGCVANKIEPIISYIRYKETDKYLFSLISNIVKYYIVTKKKSVSDIKSNDFIGSLLTAYQISNTKDPFIIEIKDTLNVVIDVYGAELQVNVGKKTTLQKVRNCIYIYIVLYIAKNN